MKVVLFICLTLVCAQKEKPNIVFVMLDDLGWSNVGFHNPEFKVTPFLDQMAQSENAMELTNAYATHRCSPSRAALLTGVYPFRYGLGSDAMKVMDLLRVNSYFLFALTKNLNG